MKNLGNLQSVHKIQWQSKVVGIVCGFLLILFAGLFVVWLFTDESLATKKNGFLLVVLISVCSVGSLMLGVFLIKEGFRIKNEEVCLYENGFIYSTKKVIHTIKWEEIEKIYENAVAFVSPLNARLVREYTIKMRGGNQFIIGSGFKNIEKIGERLKTETFKCRLPIIWNQLNSGEIIDFDKLILNQNYISTPKGKTLPLADVGRIDVEEGKIRIFKSDSGRIWDKFDYSLIPNAPILLTILKKM